MVDINTAAEISATIYIGKQVQFKGSLNFLTLLLLCLCWNGTVK